MAARSKAKVERVNHPTHYNGIEIEAIDVLEQADDFRLATAMKYIWRTDPALGGGGKNQGDDAERDIESAIWYLCRYLGYVPETVID